MRNAVALARDRLDETAGQLFTRREANRVNDDVEPIPVLAEFREHRVDLFITSNIAGKQEIGVLAEAFRELLDPAFELLVLVGKRDFSAFASERFCYT